MKNETAGQKVTIQGIETLRVLSINHRAHGFANLSRLVATAHAESLREALDALGVESILLSTCNRCEIYWRAQDSEGEAATLRILEESFGLRPGELAARATLLRGDAVAAYLFRVCAGLESAVLGEAEILGQVRAGLESSPRAGSFLTGLFHAALRAGGAARA